MNKVLIAVSLVGNMPLLGANSSKNNYTMPSPKISAALSSVRSLDAATEHISLLDLVRLRIVQENTFTADSGLISFREPLAKIFATTDPAVYDSGMSVVEVNRRLTINVLKGLRRQIDQL